MVVRTARHLDTLLDRLVERMATGDLGPLDRETVVVARNVGLRDWITLRLASRLGCAAGLDLVSPRALAVRLAREIVKDVPVPTGPDGRPLPADPFERDGLQWRLHALLPRLPAAPPFGPVRGFLDRAGPDGQLLLAARLAALYDDYQVYRPDLLVAWEAGSAPRGDVHADWQAELWRRLTAPGGAQGVSRAATLERLIEAVEGHGSRHPAVPKRVTVFGAFVFPPVYLRVLQALARHSDVEFLAAVPTGTRPPHAPAHPVLADLGRRGPELFRVFDRVAGGTARIDPLGTAHLGTAHLGTEAEGAGLEAEARSHLATLQADLAADRPRASNHRHRLDSTDASLTVHDCHSPQREVEVLRDQVLDAFDALDGLRPHDVLVMVPDLATYAPLLDAVFGAEGVGGALPVHVVGHPYAPARRVLEAAGRVLGLPGGRVTATDLLELLDVPVLRWSSGIRPDELATLRSWARRTHVHWGRDGAHKKTLGLPESDVHTWQHGLDRLFMEFVMGGPGAPALVEGRLALGAPVDPDLLGRFAAWAGRLFGHADAWAAGPQSLDAWAGAFGHAFDDLLEPRDDEEHEALVWLRAQVADLAHLHHLASDGAPVAFPAVRRHLLDAIGGYAEERRTLTGRITAALPMDLRHAPFRMIAFLGLGAGSWPPSHTPDALDLIAADPRPGDNDPASTGRHLVLDALLAAQDRLVFSWVGRSERDNSPLSPSPALSVVLDALDRTFVAEDARRAREHLVVSHRLQPFSHAYFDGRDERLFSYSAPHQTAADAASRPAAFLETNPPPPEPPPDTVDAATLADAWTNPSRHFCEARLGLRLRRFDDAPTDDEPLGLDGLDAYGAKDDLLALVLAGTSEREMRARLRASGRLPTGPLADVWYDRLRAAVGPVAERVRSVPGGHPRDVTARSASATVTAHLAYATDGLSVQARCARVKTKDLVAGWLAHLARSVEAGAPVETWVVGENIAWRFGAVDRPETYLDWMVRGWHAIREAPPPLFERASRRYAEERHKMAWQGDGSSALGKAEAAYFGGWKMSAEVEEDPYVALCFRARDPLATPDFEKWARCLWKPILEHGEELP